MWSTCGLVTVMFVCVSAQYSSSFSRSFNSSSGGGSGSACFNTQTGYTTDDVRTFAYYLEPRETHFEIVFPDYPDCNKVGVAVSVCETGAASTQVQLMDTVRAFVHRSGNLEQAGQADVDVYCG